MGKKDSLSECTWLKYDTDDQTPVSLKSWGLLIAFWLRRKGFLCNNA